MWKRCNCSSAFRLQKKKVNWLQKKTEEKDFSVSSVHRGIDRKERDKVTHEFQNSYSNILISTDVSISESISLKMLFVINYDLSTIIENYLQRIGIFYIFFFIFFFFTFFYNVYTSIIFNRELCNI
jgi:superfamily II DNA helicase RecQ